ncbi:unnamed protein product [Lepidochelys olivacea]
MQACSRLAPGGAAPSPGQEGVVVLLGALQPILCLLIALLIPCVVLLFLLDCLLLPRLLLCPLPARQRGRRRQRQLGDQSPPATAASAPSSPIACRGPGPAVGLALRKGWLGAPRGCPAAVRGMLCPAIRGGPLETCPPAAARPSRGLPAGLGHLKGPSLSGT